MERLGYIRLHRKLIDKAIWKTSTANQKAVLIVVLLLANHDHQQWEWNGKQYECEPGEFITSTRKIAEYAGVNRQVVRDCLKRFARLEFATHDTTHESTRVKINNWADYQAPPTQKGTQDTNKQSPSENPAATTNKNDNNNNNKPKSPKGEYGSDGFKKFWNVHPKKEGKKGAWKVWQRDGLEDIADTIIAALELQARTKWKGKDLQYIKGPEPWLNGRHWEDEIAGHVVAAPAKPRHQNFIDAPAVLVKPDNAQPYRIEGKRLSYNTANACLMLDGQIVHWDQLEIVQAS